MKTDVSLLTNDGWVVTLVSDKQISIGDAIISSIIVAREEYTGSAAFAQKPPERGIHCPNPECDCHDAG